jgi:hypothetical protein
VNQRKKRKGHALLLAGHAVAPPKNPRKMEKAMHRAISPRIFVRIILPLIGLKKNLDFRVGL